MTGLSCANLLTTLPNFDRIEKFLTCGSSPSSIANPGYEPNLKSDAQLLIFIRSPIKSPSFQDLLMTSLHVICGLALLPIQSPGHACALNHVQYAYQIPVVAS